MTPPFPKAKKEFVLVGKKKVLPMYDLIFFLQGV
jgi:hypothetical protein